MPRHYFMWPMGLQITLKNVKYHQLWLSLKTYSGSESYYSYTPYYIIWTINIVKCDMVNVIKFCDFLLNHWTSFYLENKIVIMVSLKRCINSLQSHQSHHFILWIKSLLKFTSCKYFYIPLNYTSCIGKISEKSLT